MALVSVSSPFDTLLNLQRNIDRLFNTSPALDMGLSGRGAFPPVNVFSEKDGYVVRMEAPGLQLDQLWMESHGRTLMLKGERALKTPEGGSFHRRERKSGSFARSLQMPADSDMERVEAAYQHGMLTIRIPKREEAKPRQNSVKAA
jgi:HSP20 family protein